MAAVEIRKKRGFPQPQGNPNRHKIQANPGAAGYRFSNAMGGETAFGGQEIVVAMVKTASDPGVRQYKLLATARTSTMQKELQDAANQGYEYRAQTVYETAFGGKEVVVILERNSARPERQTSYKLLAVTNAAVKAAIGWP